MSVLGTWAKVIGTEPLVSYIVTKSEVFQQALYAN